MDSPSAETGEPATLDSALYVVATPIGNLGDLSERAQAILRSVDLIACEDTRTTGRLLSRVGSTQPTISYHDHNETERAEELAERIAGGESVAVVSDAGTPTLSDPGFRVVRACQKRRLRVVPVPGASALLAALSASGLPTDAFFYAGFLPPKSAARRRFLVEHRAFPHTIVVFESCHRIEKFLAEMVDLLGPDRVVCVARELTKRFETIRTGPLSVLANEAHTLKPKGEFVVIIAPETFTL